MEKIQIRMIIEIMGRPPEHITEALEKLIETIGKEKGVTLAERKINVPVPVKDSDLFTTFASVEMEVDSVMTFFKIIFTYMPSNVELIYPETLKMKNDDINGLANAIVARLHDYDAIAKKLIIDRDIMMKQLGQMKAVPAVNEVKKEQKPKKSKKKSKKA